MAFKHGLGRGLSALINETPATAGRPRNFLLIDSNRIMGS